MYNHNARKYLKKQSSPRTSHIVYAYNMEVNNEERNAKPKMKQKQKFEKEMNTKLLPDGLAL